MTNIKKLEKKLWDACDLLRADSNVTSQEYCMPVLGLIFLRYAFSRFTRIEKEILRNIPMRNGKQRKIESEDFKSKSAIYLPEEARYDYLVSRPNDFKIGEAINKAMTYIEEESPQLKGILPKNYTTLQDSVLYDLLRIFNDNDFNEIEDDMIGRIYEYFLNKFAPSVASDDGVFFTPKSLVSMIVNIIEPIRGTILDPACGSGGMFVASYDFIKNDTTDTNDIFTFYGQEKVEYNAKLCFMNMAIHGLNAKISSGDGANSFYNDSHNLEGKCDYVMANPPFNVDKIKADSCQNAGRLVFGLPGVNKKTKQISNGNYLWISYFYSYLKEKGRAGFVMASSATDSQNADKDIRERLIKSCSVDVMISVSNNFFYTKSLPCSLWFFDKGKKENIKDKILFIDARNYYTMVERSLNEWSSWQIKNLNAIVWLYRGEIQKYTALIQEYRDTLSAHAIESEDQEIKDAIDQGRDFAKTIANLQNHKEKIIIKSKEAIQKAKDDIAKAKAKKEKYKGERPNQIKALYDKKIVWIDDVLQIAKEGHYLYDKFGDGVYTDVLGLCKIATLDEVADKGYSLTPGAYVGVAATEDDGVNFAQHMINIHNELLSLQTESNDLMNTISQNMKRLGL